MQSAGLIARNQTHGKTPLVISSQMTVFMSAVSKTVVFRILVSLTEVSMTGVTKTAVSQTPVLQTSTVSKRVVKDYL
jgi:hypothetical protein